MFRVFYLLLLFILPLNAVSVESVNPIIGNQGYRFFFKKEPTKSTPEEVRVASHLYYAAFLLYISQSLTLTNEKRIKMIQYLLEYAETGVYPKNESHPDERKPCFVYGQGTVCAVGYLLGQSEGMDEVIQVNEAFQYDYIQDMDSVYLLHWAIENGLTLKDCAIIQPTYEFFERPPTKQLAFSIESSARPISTVYSRFEMEFIRSAYKRDKSKYSLAFYGIHITPLRNSNFETGISYARPLKTIRGRLGLKAGIGLDAFSYNENWGMNLNPELAMRYAYAKGKVFFATELSYAYKMGLVNASIYEVPRNDIGASLGIGFFIR